MYEVEPLVKFTFNSGSFKQKAGQNNPRGNRFFSDEAASHQIFFLLMHCATAHNWI